MAEPKTTSDARDEELRARVVDLELRYMKQEKMLQDLSDVLVAQQRAIDRLVAEVATLRDRMLDELGDPIDHERPPHY